MELVDGRTFIDYMKRTPGREPPAGSDISGPYVVRLESILKQLVEGIIALHAAGKLHMDLKPHNVLVTGEGRVVLLDFGLVRELNPEAMDHESMVSAFVGTPHYASPEQAAGREVSASSDWYSVGVMLYQLFAGKLPVTGRTLLALMENKQTRVPRPLKELVPGVPEHLDSLCADLLRIRPDERPSGKDILDRLKPIFQRGTAAKVPASAADRPKEVGILLGIGPQALAIRSYDLYRLQIVDRQAVFAR